MYTGARRKWSTHAFAGNWSGENCELSLGAPGVFVDATEHLSVHVA